MSSREINADSLVFTFDGKGIADATLDANVNAIVRNESAMFKQMVNDYFENSASIRKLNFRTIECSIDDNSQVRCLIPYIYQLDFAIDKVSRLAHIEYTNESANAERVCATANAILVWNVISE